MAFDVDGALKSGYTPDDVAAAIGFDIKGARAAGHSDADIIAELHQGGASASPDSAPAGDQDTSFTGALRYGASGPAAGLGATATALGGVATRNGLPTLGGYLGSAGSALTGAAGSLAPAHYAPAGKSLVDALRAGNLKEAASYLPRAAVEQAPDMAATLGSGVAGPAGPATYLAARNLGQTADARAANNGETATSTADVLGALPSTAAQAALGTMGLGKFGASARLAAAAPAILRPAVRAGEEALASGANDVAGQLGNTAGTSQGASVDPAEVAGAAVQGGASRLVSEVPHGIASAVGAATDQVLQRMQPEITDPEHAGSIARSIQEIAKSQADALQSGDGQLPLYRAANNAKTTVANGLEVLIRDQRKLGFLDDAGYAQVKAALDQAQRHNNTLSDGDGSTFAAVKAISLQPDVKTALVNGLRDLNTLSTQSFQNKLQGPYQKLFTTLGNLGAVAGGLATGNPIEALTGAVLGKTHIPGKVAGVVGAGLDRAFGTAVPNIMLQRLRAQQALKAAGQAAGPLSTDALASVNGATRDPNAGLYHQLGLGDPTPPTETAEGAAQGRIENAGRTREQTAIDLSQQTGTAPTGSPLGLQIIARRAAALNAMRAARPEADVQNAQFDAGQDHIMGLADDANAQFDQQARITAKSQADLTAMTNRIKVRSALKANRDQAAQDRFTRANDMADAAVMDAQRTRDANSQAATQAQGDADVERMGRQANAAKAVQEAAMIRQNAKDQTARSSGFDKAQAQVAATKADQEDAMWGTEQQKARDLQKIGATRVAGTTQSEVRGHLSDIGKLSAAKAKAKVALQSMQDRGTNLSERAADQVSGMAYNALGAREARSNGVVGAKATGVGASPAYKASGGEFGAPGGEAPIVQKAPVASPVEKAAARRAMKEALKAPASASQGAQAATPPAEAVAAPQAPPGAPVAPAGRPSGFGQAPPEGLGFMRGHQAYVHKALSDHNIPSDAQDQREAVQSMVVNGSLAKVMGVHPEHPDVPLFAQRLLESTGYLHGEKGKQVMNLIAAQIAQNKGLTHRLADNSQREPGSTQFGSQVPNPSGVRDPIKWEAARQDAKQHVDKVAAREQSAGNRDLARVVREVGAPQTAAQKVALAEAYWKSLPRGRGAQADYAAHAKAVLSDPTLLKGV